MATQSFYGTFVTRHGSGASEASDEGASMSGVEEQAWGWSPPSMGRQNILARPGIRAPLRGDPWDSEESRSSGASGRWVWLPDQPVQDRERNPNVSMQNSRRAEQGSTATPGESIPHETVPAGFGADGELPTGEVRTVGAMEADSKENADGKGDKVKPGKVSSSYPPIFRAKPGEPYLEWKRAVQFWIGGEGDQLPASYRGPRLMVQLRDRAAQLVRHLELSDVQKSTGMELIFKTLEASPLVKQMDKHKVDQQRRRMMALDRVPGESMESYVTRANIYRVQLQGMDGSLAMGERFFVGHLLDHSRLTRKDNKAMVRTRAGSESEADVTAALLDLSAELEGEPGFPIGFSEPNMAGHHGEEFLVQRSTGYKKVAARPALVAMGEGEDQSETLSMLGEEGDSVDEEAPSELVEFEKEAFALQFRAKQKMAEVKKMRQYYQKRDPEERRKELAEKMKDTHCHACGEKGHWSRECPRKRSQQVLMASSGRGAMRSIPESQVADQGEWDLLVSLCSRSDPKDGSASAREVYMALPMVGVQTPSSCIPNMEDTNGFDILWSMTELQQGVILDLGCMKNVAGTGWANQLVKQWKLNGWWFNVVPEQETFRFGNGSTLKSRFSIQFVATFMGRPVSRVCIFCGCWRLSPAFV